MQTGNKQRKKLTAKELEVKVEDLQGQIGRLTQVVERFGEAIFGNPSTGSVGLINAYDNVDTRSLAVYRLLVDKKDVTEETFLAQVAEIRKESDALKLEAQYNKMGFQKAENATIEEGDLVVFGSSGTVDGQSFEGSKVENGVMIVGKQEPFAGFSENFTGKTEGDKIDFVATLPEDYAMKDIAGKMVRYQCDIRAVRKPIQTKELPTVQKEEEAKEA